MRCLWLGGCLRNWNQWVRDWARQNWNTTKKAPRFWVDHHPKRAAIWQGRKWQIPIDMWAPSNDASLPHNVLPSCRLLGTWVCYEYVWNEDSRSPFQPMWEHMRTKKAQRDTLKEGTSLFCDLALRINSNLHSTVDSNDNTVFSKTKISGKIHLQHLAAHSCIQIWSYLEVLELWTQLPE